VTGQAKYAADFPTKNLAFAVAFTSPISKGHIRSIDASAAQSQPA